MLSEWEGFHTLSPVNHSDNSKSWMPVSGHVCGRWQRPCDVKRGGVWKNKVEWIYVYHRTHVPIWGRKCQGKLNKETNLHDNHTGYMKYTKAQLISQ